MDQARHYLDMAKQRAPNNPEVQRSLAGYYRSTGDYAKAIDALKSIHNPKPPVLAELAYTYQLSGQPDQSAALYAQAANAMPKDIGLQLSAAQAAVGAVPLTKLNRSSSARRRLIQNITGCTPFADKLPSARRMTRKRSASTTKRWQTCPRRRRKARFIRSSFT